MILVHVKMEAAVLMGLMTLLVCVLPFQVDTMQGKHVLKVNKFILMSLDCRGTVHLYTS